MKTEKEIKAQRRRPIKKTTLFPLSEVEIDGVATRDPPAWAAEAECDFELRWRQGMASDVALFESLNGASELHVPVFEKDILGGHHRA